MRTIIRALDNRASYGIWFYKDEGNRTYLAQPAEIKFVEIESNAFALPNPTIELRYEFAQEFLQSMVNGLIEHGVRPNNDKTAGELEATKKHLKDMQEIVNRLLNQLDKN